MITDIHTRIWDSTEQLGLAAEIVRRRGTDPWARPDGSRTVHTAAMALYQACADRNVPILVEHQPWLVPAAQLEFAQPYLFDEVARTYPDLKLVIGALGHPWVEQALVLLCKHRSVYADISEIIHHPLQLYQALLAALQQGVMDQILFGSGFPFGDPETAILTLYSINTLSHGSPLPTVARQHLRSIVERDALSCLGLQNSFDARSQPTEQVESADQPLRQSTREPESDLAAPQPEALLLKDTGL